VNHYLFQSSKIESGQHHEFVQEMYYPGGLKHR